MQRRIYGHATNVEIRPLNEEKAVQAAADLLGELFVFTVILFSSFQHLLLEFLLEKVICDREHKLHAYFFIELGSI